MITRTLGRNTLVVANWDLPWAKDLRSLLTQTVGVLGRLAEVAIPDRALQVIGWSASADRLVRTWLWPWDLDEGVWLIGSATEANTSDAKRYKEAP